MRGPVRWETSGSPPSPRDERDERDERTGRLLDEIAAIEDRLDPRPRRRGQRLADLALLVLIGAATILLDLELRYPILLIGLLFAGRGLTHLVARASGRSLRRERDRLLEPGSQAPTTDPTTGEGP